MKNIEVLVCGASGKVGSKTLGILREASVKHMAMNEKRLSIHYMDFDKKADPEQHYDFVFICVPTDLKEGEVDTSIVDKCLKDYKADYYVIRSTVPPEFLESRVENIIFWPEFYAWTGNQAKAFPEVIGCDCTGDRDALLEVILPAYPSSQRFRLTDMITASIAKYAINSFLALKVQFARGIYDWCGDFGGDYQEVREIMGDDERIGISHLQVISQPKGSHCLNKDVPIVLKKFLGE